jgi:hypothetical protein
VADAMLNRPMGTEAVLREGVRKAAEQLRTGGVHRPDSDDFGVTVAAPLFPEYAQDPEGFARRLGVPMLTPDQVAIALSVRDNAETNVQAGISVGKTLVAAVLVLWWVYAVGGIAITTAPSMKQVRDLLWKEIRRLFDRNRAWLGGTRDLMQIKLAGEQVAWGFTASENSEEGFGGRHHPWIMAVEDEASGISQMADDGVTSNLTYYTNRLLRIGNPFTDGTPFHHACEARCIKIPVWEHPNVVWAYAKGDDEVYRLHPDVRAAVAEPGSGDVRPRNAWPRELQRLANAIPGGPSIEFIEGKRREKRRGPGTAYWKSRFDAAFPTDSSGSLIPRAWWDAARARYDQDPRKWDEMALAHPWVHALDVGDGVEPHALASRRGPVLYALAEYPTLGDRQDVARAEGYARVALGERKGEIVVDDIGVGSGVLSGLLEDGQPARGMRDAVYDSERYVSARADMLWTLREELENGTLVIAPLGEDVEESCREELAQIRKAAPTSKGKVRAELKEETSKRIGHSPNLADAVAMTCTRGTALLDLEMIEDGFLFEDPSRGF